MPCLFPNRVKKNFKGVAPVESRLRTTLRYYGDWKFNWGLLADEPSEAVFSGEGWCRGRELNSRPWDYEAHALTTELPRQANRSIRTGHFLMVAAGGGSSQSEVNKAGRLSVYIIEQGNCRRIERI